MKNLITDFNHVLLVLLIPSLSYSLDGILLRSGIGHIGVLHKLSQDEVIFVILNDDEKIIVTYSQKDILAIYNILGGNMVSVPKKGDEYFSPTKKYLKIERTEQDINNIFLIYYDRGKWLNEDKQIWIEETLRAEYLISSEIEKEQHNESSNMNQIGKILKDQISE